MKVGTLYRNVRDRFRSAGLESPELDAKLLVSAGLGVRPGDVILLEDRVLDAAMEHEISRFADQRIAGKPVGRVLGLREFFGLRFELNDDTLEPRPDTEVLVDAVLARSLPDAALCFADLGTGTGAIAIAVLTERPRAVGVAVDISLNALSCAQKNAAINGVGSRFWAVRSDFGAALSNGFDWVVSNPPYIRSEVLGTLSVEVRQHDPVLALDGGPDGLSAYRQILADSNRMLRSEGRIALEIGYDQGVQVSDLLTEFGFFDVEIIQDLAGRDRVIVARRGETDRIFAGGEKALGNRRINR